MDLDQLGEEQLWVQWQRTGDAAVRQVLSERYLPYARALAAKSYARRVHNEFEFDEYFHFAVVGMMESFSRYVPQRGAQFKTFATPRMLGAILNGLDTLSERQQQVAFRRRLERERMDSLKALTRAPYQGQAQLQELVDIGIGVALGFLLEGTCMISPEEHSLPDNAYAPIELRQLQDWVVRLVDRLTDREAQVIRRHYFQQQAFEEIAQALQLTKGRISQLHRQGLERLRKLLKEDGACDKLV